jgi:hypothetical protein
MNGSQRRGNQAKPLALNRILIANEMHSREKSSYSNHSTYNSPIANEFRAITRPFPQLFCGSKSSTTVSAKSITILGIRLASRRTIRAERRTLRGAMTTGAKRRTSRSLLTGLVLVLAAFFSTASAYASSSCYGTRISASNCALLCAANMHPISPGGSVSSPVSVAQTISARSHEMSGMPMDLSPSAQLLMAEASGTSLNPLSVGMPARMKMAGAWSLMAMADGFITDTQQTGPRGADKLYSTNVFMGSAEHAIGHGSFLFDAMLSLEPATITDRRYPLLFQTGETAFGVPIEDSQHPHNLFMALGLHYAHPLGENTLFEAYFAPVGDPALGPVAFPHRASASEIPQAPIGHHWEDSTHIAYEVLTVGLKRKSIRLELSGFHGAEPGENRWNIPAGAIDSWAARFSVFPAPNWTAQVSVGRLTKPEALEPGDVVRTTASVSYSRPIDGSSWSTSFIFGRNHNTADGLGTNAFLLESVIPFRRKNFFTGRWEMVDKDELFAAQPALEQQLAATAGSVFRIGEYTFGYTRYVRLVAPLDTGFGANFSTYTLPSAITPYYGEHPFGVNIYLRFRLRARNQ